MADKDEQPDAPLGIELRPGMDPRELGRLLRAARLGAQLTQAELGRRMGVVQNTVARIEGGKSPPTLETLARFVRAAGYRSRLELELVASAPAPTKRKKAPPGR